MILVRGQLATLLVVDGELIEHGRGYLKEGLWVAVILSSTVYVSRKAKKGLFRGFLPVLGGVSEKLNTTNWGGQAAWCGLKLLGQLRLSSPFAGHFPPVSSGEGSSAPAL